MIKIRYRCLECVTEADVECPERLKAVDIVYWMNRVVMPRLGSKHKEISPDCNANHFDVMIPFGDGIQVLGQKHDKNTPG